MTIAAKWRENGEQDPHGDQYDCEREKLCKGDLTDDELANAVFLCPDIGNLTAAKERIRWLSRKLEQTKKDND
jgi:hypothetical protein